MRLWVLKLLPILFLSERSAFSGQAVTLTAAIVHFAGHPVSLKLNLRNNDTASVSILTGVMADRAYPAANFSFFLQTTRPPGIRLDCASCAPAMIGGTLGEFTITLAPGQTSLVAMVPLSEFSYPDGAHVQHPCTRRTSETRLTVGLQGRRLPTAPLLQEHYWTGSASVTIPLACGDESRPQLK